MIIFPYRRLLPLALTTLAIAGLSAPMLAHAYEPQASSIAADDAGSDWLYAGSDIPRDEAWRFGTLPNGLRYAVRNNGSPPNQVSIRVRIGAGSLMETDSERGFAHFIEHLSFRGSRYLDDGETKRTWQRLGAAFGSDTNASTSPTSTIYKLDLPAVTSTSLDEAMKVLSGMVEAPNLDERTVASERGVVLSELRESTGPQARVGDALREHMFNGQLLADRIPIGTEASLNQATAASLAAFHQRWYRPDNVVIAVAGDLSQDQLEAAITKHFGAWKSAGPLPEEPDFGDPVPGLPVARIVQEPTQPEIATISYLRPWRRVLDTVAYTQSLYHDAIALRIVNRRLEERARNGGSFIIAQVGEEAVSRSAKVTSINIVPAEGWDVAMRDVRGIIADALLAPPSQKEIDREYAEFDVLMRREVENSRNEPGSELVDDLMESVDIGETVADISDHLELMRSSRPTATPDRMLAVIRKLFSGEVVRAFLSSKETVAEGETNRLAQLATMAVAPDSSARMKSSNATIADLPKLGAAGSVIANEALPVLGIRKLTLSNGVSALIYDSPVEPDKIRIRVRFGGGLKSIDPSQPNALWAGDMALVESGIGTLDIGDIEAIANGRLLTLDFSIDDSAFVFNAETNSADFIDQLRLIAAKLDRPGWKPAPVRRARVVELAGYDARNASPVDVLNRFLESQLRPGDERFDAPTREEVDQMTPAAFKKFWAPLLAKGPVEVLIFGDLTKVDAGSALAQTFGALKDRKTLDSAASYALPFPVADGRPSVLAHSGDAEQAAAILTWQTGGGVANIRESRQLDVLAAIFNDRLFDRLRSSDGASYSPSVGSSWPRDYPSGGYVMAAGLVNTGDINGFFRHARDIAEELAAQPVSLDELSRAVTPIREYVYRASSGNVFFMNQLEGASSDPGRVPALRNYVSDITSTTPADIQRLARTYLSGDGFSLVVLPQNVSLDSVWSPYVATARNNPVVAPNPPQTAAESR